LPNFYDQGADNGPKSSRDTPSSNIEDTAEDENDTKYKNKRLAHSQINLATSNNFGKRSDINVFAQGTQNPI
jgi:hypothetical protein